jgi:hypothetical protein
MNKGERTGGDKGTKVIKERKNGRENYDRREGRRNTKL